MRRLRAAKGGGGGGGRGGGGGGGRAWGWGGGTVSATAFILFGFVYCGRHRWALGQSPVRDTIAVTNRRPGGRRAIECERVAIGEPDDDKPFNRNRKKKKKKKIKNNCRWANWLLSAFHQHKSRNTRFSSRCLLFRSRMAAHMDGEPDQRLRLPRGRIFR